MESLEALALELNQNNWMFFLILQKGTTTFGPTRTFGIGSCSRWTIVTFVAYPFRLVGKSLRPAPIGSVRSETSTFAHSPVY